MVLHTACKVDTPQQPADCQPPDILTVKRNLTTILIVQICEFIKTHMNNLFCRHAPSYVRTHVPFLPMLIWSEFIYQALNNLIFEFTL